MKYHLNSLAVLTPVRYAMDIDEDLVAINAHAPSITRAAFAILYRAGQRKALHAPDAQDSLLLQIDPDVRLILSCSGQDTERPR